MGSRAVDIRKPGAPGSDQPGVIQEASESAGTNALSQAPGRVWLPVSSRTVVSSAAGRTWFVEFAGGPVVTVKPQGVDLGSPAPRERAQPWTHARTASVVSVKCTARSPGGGG